MHVVVYTVGRTLVGVPVHYVHVVVYTVGRTLVGVPVHYVHVVVYTVGRILVGERGAFETVCSRVKGGLSKNLPGEWDGEPPGPRQSGKADPLLTFTHVAGGGLNNLSSFDPRI